MFLKEIKNHLKEIRKNEPYRFFKKVEDFNYNNFLKNLNNKKFVLEAIDKLSQAIFIF